MRIRAFSPHDYPAMVDIHNSLNISWPERPRTPEAWAMGGSRPEPFPTGQACALGGNRG